MPELTEHEQVSLVEAAVAAGGFSGDLADILVTLAGNPSLTLAGRERIAECQEGLGLFSDDRQRLAEALANSGASAASDRD